MIPIAVTTKAAIRPLSCGQTARCAGSRARRPGPGRPRRLPSTRGSVADDEPLRVHSVQSHLVRADGDEDGSIAQLPAPSNAGLAAPRPMTRMAHANGCRNASSPREAERATRSDDGVRGSRTGARPGRTTRPDQPAGPRHGPSLLSRRPRPDASPGAGAVSERSRPLPNAAPDPRNRATGPARTNFQASAGTRTSAARDRRPRLRLPKRSVGRMKLPDPGPSRDSGQWFERF